LNKPFHSEPVNLLSPSEYIFVFFTSASVNWAMQAAALTCTAANYYCAGGSV
jgi:hypothetical protein